MKKAKLLLIEDDPDNLRSVREAAEDADFTTICATTGGEGVELFKAELPELVLSDLVLPDFDGLQVLRQIRQLDERVPIIIMTAYASLETGLAAMRQGAYDYITKPLDLDDIQSKLRRALEAARLRSRVDQFTRTFKARYGAAGILAESEGMRRIMGQVETVADTTATIMITGESGTGKELVARALHYDSKRAEGPFVAVNCGAFAESLLESELFGHEKGAFTGATAMHQGAFERADGGTLFLDEIGDAPAAVQVKLLRALEEREIRRVGGRAVVKVNVRLLSATNRDLDELVAQGSFREDLLYRLKVVTLHIPPLRERRADIRPLTDRFIGHAVEEYGRPVAVVQPDFYSALEEYEWPGNVRQLRNIVESAVLLAPQGILNREAVALVLPAGSARISTVAGGIMIPDNLTFEQIERVVLEEKLRRNAGNRTLTAEQLGLSRRTIQRKIEELKLPF